MSSITKSYNVVVKIDKDGHFEWSVKSFDSNAKFKDKKENKDGNFSYLVETNMSETDLKLLTTVISVSPHTENNYSSYVLTSGFETGIRPTNYVTVQDLMDYVSANNLNATRGMRFYGEPNSGSVFSMGIGANLNFVTPPMAPIRLELDLNGNPIFLADVITYIWNNHTGKNYKQILISENKNSQNAKGFRHDYSSFYVVF